MAAVVNPDSEQLRIQRSSSPKMARAARSNNRRWTRMSEPVLLAVVLQAISISALAILQHRSFGSWGFDFAIYDQAWWLIGQDAVSSTSLITMRGMPVWGHHINGVLLLLAPFARLGFGPEFLIVVQAFTLAVGALPLSWLARTKTGSARIGGAFAAMYLLYPAVGWLGWVSFHPEALSITPLLFTAWFAHNRRYKRLAISILLALSCREEVGLVVGMLGLVWAIQAVWVSRSRIEIQVRSRSDLAAGLMTMVAGFGWFLLCSKVLIPAVLGGDVFYVDHFYAKYGSSMSEVAVHLATHPGTVVSLSNEPQARTYLLDLFAPLGFVPVFGAAILSAAPQLVATIAANSKFVRDVRFQYTALMIPGVFLGALNAASWMLRRSRKGGSVMIGWMVVCSCLAAFVRGPLPGSVGFSSWKLHDPAQVALERAVAIIPADAAVAAQDNIASHLSHRRSVYDFPNPFQRMVYGTPSTPDPSPDAADWIIVQPALLSAKYRPVYDRLINQKVFRVVFNEDGVVVAKRA
jgi:uncharacterized membrane protein